MQGITKMDQTKSYEWSHKRQIEFNAEKYHIINLVKNVQRLEWEYKQGRNRLQDSNNNN